MQTFAPGRALIAAGTRPIVYWLAIRLDQQQPTCQIAHALLSFACLMTQMER